MSTADIPEHEEAISRFKKFLESESHPTELLWVFREDIYCKNSQLVVRYPPPETNQQLAKSRYELGQTNGCVCITAICRVGSVIAATIDLDTHYGLEHNFEINYSFATN